MLDKGPMRDPVLQSLLTAAEAALSRITTGPASL
jgi:hypothetical protein